MSQVPSGSYLAISHMTAELEPEHMGPLVDAPGDQASYVFIMRTKTEVERFFDGLETVRGGVTPLLDWLAPEQVPAYPAAARMHWCGVGRKPGPSIRSSVSRGWRRSTTPSTTTAPTWSR